MVLLLSRLDKFWDIRFDEKSWTSSLSLISSSWIKIEEFIISVLICNFSTDFLLFLARSLAFLWDCLWNEAKSSSSGSDTFRIISKMRKKLAGSFFDLIWK